MDKIRIGILGTAEIAYRRFLPALLKTEKFEYVGIASRNLKKTEKFIESYGGCGIEDYDKMILREDIDALYIPLPPSLHFKYAKKALENGKHVLLEKPFAITLQETKELITLSKENNLAIHENYMFQFHNQIRDIQHMICEGMLGDIRLYRICFGFPFRSRDDFRYNKSLGGGALLDCGGYTLKLANILLGEEVKVVESSLGYLKNYEVDFYGTATLRNNDGLSAQVSFGMDNTYKCELEIWGSKGTLYTNRILTAPDDYEPIVNISKSDGTVETMTLSKDSSFQNSIEYFRECIEKHDKADLNRKDILRQAILVQQFKERVNNG